MNILFVLVAFVVGGVLVYLVSRPKQGSNVGFDLILQQINELNRVVDTKIGENTKQMNDSVRAQFGESAKLIREVTQGLTKLDETNKQVISFTDQLQSLQDVFKNPKHRGTIIGEYFLETLLKNVLPPGSFEMQYKFPDGTIVDAAIFIKNKIVPIDSKFSLENYNRLAEEKNPQERIRLEKVFENDLKNRIEETAKYIRPQDRTMDFAFMFIPHEAIYYDLVSGTVGATDENLIQRAAAKYKVIAISPTSLFAYLQTVLQGLNAMHIEEKAQEIVKRVEELGKHLKSYEDYYSKLGKSLSTTVNQYNSGYKELGKVDKDVLRITGTKIGLKTLTLDKPQVE